ncbi:hypothetical protein ABIB85_000164 [Bradyrhizobium sp. JR1.5]
MPSSVIRFVRYAPATRELKVTFVSGRLYVYEDLPPEVAAAFKAARSKVPSSIKRSAIGMSTVTSLTNMRASREQGYTLIDIDEPAVAEAPCPCPPCRCINCANRSYAELRELEAPGTVVDILKPSA